jgi:hypothetical protein
MLTVLFVQNQMVLQATTVGAVILEVGFYFNFWAFSIARADSQLFHEQIPWFLIWRYPLAAMGASTWQFEGWKLQFEPMSILGVALW